MMTTATTVDGTAMTMMMTMTVNAHGIIHHLRSHEDLPLRRKHNPVLRTLKRVSANSFVRTRKHVRRVRLPMDGVRTTAENVHGPMTVQDPLAVRLLLDVAIRLMAIKITILDVVTHGEGQFCCLP